MITGASSPVLLMIICAGWVSTHLTIVTPRKLAVGMGLVLVLAGRFEVLKELVDKAFSKVTTSSEYVVYLPGQQCG